MSHIDKGSWEPSVWMLRIKLRASARAVSTLRHWAISPASLLTYLVFKVSLIFTYLWVSLPIYWYWCVTSFHVEENMFGKTLVHLYLLRPVLWFSSWSSLKMFHIHGIKIYILVELYSIAVFQIYPASSVEAGYFLVYQLCSTTCIRKETQSIHQFGDVPVSPFILYFVCYLVSGYLRAL